MIENLDLIKIEVQPLKIALLKKYKELQNVVVEIRCFINLYYEAVEGLNVSHQIFKVVHFHPDSIQNFIEYETLNKKI